ncbi:MAG: hypothetical protein HYU37_02455 [Acidobacteria bacterium]|nr:hypothetical protein [Acidobacteriota bacterium]
MASFPNHHEHHYWRRRVTAAESLPTQETNMWGRVVYKEAVRCYKEYVCDACGATRGGGSCFCDPAYGDHCAIRLEFLAAQARR